MDLIIHRAFSFYPLHRMLQTESGCTMGVYAVRAGSQYWQDLHRSGTGLSLGGAKKSKTAYNAVVAWTGKAFSKVRFSTGSLGAFRRSLKTIMQERITDRKEISIEIQLAGDEFPTHEEMDLRWKLEEEIEERGIGVVGGGGAGGGRMDFSFQVESITEVNSAIEKVKQLLKEYNAFERATITINDVYEIFCEGETPNFKPGDCLSYRFDDGDYGALLVLERGYGGLNPGEELYTLVGVLEYKDSTPPSTIIFEGRKWLLATHERRRGKPYNVWLHCFDNAEVIEIGRVGLGKDEPYDCNFFLSWDIIAECYLREKNRL